MEYPSKETIEQLRKEYPVGCHVELVRMNDVQSPPVGTTGRCLGIDDAGSIMVAWSNGSHLSVLYEIDECRKIEP